MNERGGFSMGGARAGILLMLGVSVYLLYVIFKPFLTGIAWALFLATAFHPLYLFLRKVCGGREGWASALTAALVGLLIVAPSVYVASALVDGARQLLPRLEAKVRAAVPPAVGVAPAGESPAPREPAPPGGSQPRERAAAFLKGQAERYGIDLKVAALEGAQKLAALITREAGAIVQNIARTIFTIFVTLLLMAVLFRQHRQILEVIRSLIPLPERDKDQVFGRLKDTARAVFFGVMLTALIQATLGAVGWWIVGLYSPPLFGFLMFFCALLPVGGTALVWGPGVVYLFWTGQTLMGVVLILWGGLIVGTVDNFLKPLFIGGRTGLPILLVLLSIFGGIAAFGMTGLFAGPLAVTFFLFLLEIIRRERSAGAP